MTVLFIARALPVPAWFGERLTLARLSAGLRGRGHRVVIAALTQPGAEAGGEAGDVEASRASCDRLVIAGDRRRGPGELMRWWRRPFPQRAADSADAGTFATLARLVDEERPDVVHFLGGIEVSPYRETAPGRRRIITPCDSPTLSFRRARRDADDWRERLALSGPAIGAWLYERRGYRGFDRVVVNAEADRAVLQDLDRTLPVEVISNGVDGPASVTPVAERREPLLVFVGNFAHDANVRAARRLAREILPRVKRTLPFARLALVGALPPPQVTGLAAADVEVTGLVPDVAPWLDRARVFVSPMARGAGMRHTVLEALAAGAPLVATRQSCDGLGTIEGVHVVHAEDDKGLAAASVRLLTDDKVSDRLARQGRALVQTQFTWAAVVSRYEALYAGRRPS